MKKYKELSGILDTFGFEANEIKIYETLLEYGRLNAKKVAAISTVPRVTAYQNLQRLIGKGLVRKIHDSKVDAFEAVSPSVLGSIIGTKVQETESQRFNFERMLPDLLSSYNKGMRRPSVHFREGLGGFRNIYEDILDVGQDIYVIASAQKMEEYQKVIQENKIKQRKAGIKHYALVPKSNNSAPTTADKESGGKKHIKKVFEDDLALGGQFLIYGDKVSITHFSGEVSHVTIENKYIAQMFKHVFMFMWREYNKRLID